MITEHDLEQAIAECQGERNPNANTCIKLAAFYTIRNELFGKTEPFTTTEKGSDVHGYSYAAPMEQAETTIDYDSGTDFSRVIYGREQNDIWPIIDEMMEAVHMLMPKLYGDVMRRLRA